MTAFVVLAAGRGGRMGRTADYLHKALLPLHGRAMISHQLDWLAPRDARKIVLVGHRADQVRNYVELAHPDMDVEFIEVQGWNIPGNGPGASLLAAREAIGDENLIFTSCDTLWVADDRLWDAQASWAGVAPRPEGTPPERWCRIKKTFTGLQVLDKVPGIGGDAYTGLSMILRSDLTKFWNGISRSGLLNGECQVTAGLDALARTNFLTTKNVRWTDTGDEEAYAKAVSKSVHYDWSKPGEITYVLPEEDRVVKFSTDHDMLVRRARRQLTISKAVPPITGNKPGFMAYEYVPGMSGYTASRIVPDFMTKLLDWAATSLWKPVVPRTSTARACDKFYRTKTLQRVALLRQELQRPAWEALGQVNFGELIQDCIPVTFHGDFNLGNIVITQLHGFKGIDWREDFAGETGWGDLRYDLAKLLAGFRVHWENAQCGKFEMWEDGPKREAEMAQWLGGKIPHDIQVIAALSLLNSAPLHTAPLDEILVQRAVEWLGDLT